MTEFIIASFVIVGIIVLARLYYNSKKHTVDQICNHPELSDDKVKSITSMMKWQFKADKLN